MDFTTLALHGGCAEDPQTGSIVFPIYQTSTFAQDEPASPHSFQGRQLVYSRVENPTRTALETTLAALEGGTQAIALSSGLAAANTALNLLKTGDHVIVCQDLYGGCYRLMTRVYAKFGVEFTFVDMTDLGNIERALHPETRMIWIETPSNPLINIIDIEGACKIAHEHNALTLIDSTFATPYLQNPLKYGADIVMHSMTKSINGHCDVIGGVLITDNDELAEELKYYQGTVGAVPGPQDCFLVIRGLKTLELRMERQCDNAEVLAALLNDHPAVKSVNYPGLDDDPGHAIAKKQMRRFGAMIAFEMKGGYEAAHKALSSLGIFTLAESLGGVKSLICHPASMTHKSIEPEVRRAAGIVDGLVRLSVGIENINDLREDLERALDTV